MKLLAALSLIIIASQSIAGDQEDVSAFDALRDTRFLIFTRFNPTIPQIGDIHNMDSVRNSNWNAVRPTRVLVHGQLSDGTSEVITVLTEAYLRNYDVNVLVVDWGLISQNINYVAVRNQVENVGVVGALFLDNLHAAGLMDFGRLTIACHSLGAHVGGFMGKRVTRGRVDTIVG